MRTSLVILFLLPTFPACAVTREEANNAESSRVQGGSSDTVKAHNFSVGIASRLGAICSGTLIAPNLVLTARHCVVPPDEKEVVTCADVFPRKTAPASTLFVSTEPSLKGAKVFYGVKEIITPTESGFCGNDIALVILDKNIPKAEAQPATPVIFSMTDRTKIGGTVAAMGYGITNPAADDSGIRRLRQNIDILCVPGDENYDCKKHYAARLDSNREFITAGYVCSGDSGGGAFDQTSFTHGTPFVLGALSRGPETDKECLAAIYSRTDAHARMMVTAGKKAASRGGYTAPAWVNVPLPPESTASCEGETCTSSDPTEPEPEPTVEETSSSCAAMNTPATMGGTRTRTLGSGLLALAVLGMARRRRRRVELR